MLVNDGFIIRHQGKGSIVQGQPKGIGILSLTGTTSAIGQDNLTTRIIVKPQIRSWEHAFGFEISEKEKSLGCIHMERLRLINDIPVFYDITMIPNLNLPRFTSRTFENRSLFEILRKHYQVQVKGGEQKIQAITADERIQKHFRVKKTIPSSGWTGKWKPTGRIFLFTARSIATPRITALLDASDYPISKGW